MSNRGESGRFIAGNSAARGRRPPVRATARLVELVDQRLRIRDVELGLDDVVADAVMQIIDAARKGDQDANRWLAERFFPREREQPVACGRLPSPTKHPHKYIDALARAVGRGELTTAQASRLANLIKADDLLADLERRINEMERLRVTL